MSGEPEPGIRFRLALCMARRGSRRSVHMGDASPLYILWTTFGGESSKRIVGGSKPH